MAAHVPVLEREVIDLLQPQRGGTFVDATLGMGGHSEAILRAADLVGARIRLIGIDQDPDALALAAQRLGERVTALRGNFGDIDFLLDQEGIGAVDGVLMDIGVSSYQLDTPERGFSFSADGPLDMRMDPGGDVSAASIVNSWPEHKLADLFFRYGEERLSRKIARFIVEDRRKEPFTRTLQLAEMIARAYPPHQRYKRPHPATRVFQALRIEVNRELEVLERGLDAAAGRLSPGGVLAVISFHSLEDRIVKHRFRELAASGGYELLTKKPLEASDDEAEANPRSRSAKARAVRRLAAS